MMATQTTDSLNTENHLICHTWGLNSTSRSLHISPWVLHCLVYLFDLTPDFTHGDQYRFGVGSRPPLLSSYGRHVWKQTTFLFESRILNNSELLNTGLAWAWSSQQKNAQKYVLYKQMFMMKYIPLNSNSGKIFWRLQIPQIFRTVFLKKFRWKMAEILPVSST
jgi:hypothetical protein